MNNEFFLIIGSIFFIISILLLLRTKFIRIEKTEQLKERQRLEEENRYLKSQKKILEKEIDDANKIIKDEHFKLGAISEEVNNKNTKLESLSKEYNIKKQEYDKLVSNYDNVYLKLSEIDKKVDTYQEQQKEKVIKRIEDFKKVTEQAANHYIDTIEKSYQSADAAHAQKMASLKEEQDSAAADLNKLKETRKAAYEALLKQKQVKENKDNYRLIPSSLDLQDIHKLEGIKSELRQPRILSMLIWQTYYQPLAKRQFPIILKGNPDGSGIYKITNLQTDECYIGQTVDFYKRWCEHCKAGLGIDTPVGNKLYKAIKEYGLQNFTFEVLCECSTIELNEKERYFIELYQADMFGYNSQKGNK